ncbi:MAG: thioredoxin domain-containing protein [Patescibacteria group bacterium]|jgi:protein-disulfide isomerase
MNTPTPASVPDPHLFTAHSNARLTFIIGTVVGILIMTLIGAGFFMYALSGGNIGTYTTMPLDFTPSLLKDATAPVTASQASVIVPDEQHIFGAKENYTVTLVEYVDVECRFCKKFFPEVNQFVNDHPNNVRLIIKHYPLEQIHPQAKLAAMAAECAAKQNKLREYLEQLYEFQINLSTETELTVAKSLELNIEQFQQCLALPATEQQISKDATEAVSLDLHSQPALIIWHNDGKLESVNGYVNHEYLESELKTYLNP